MNRIVTLLQVILSCAVLIIAVIILRTLPTLKSTSYEDEKFMEEMYIQDNIGESVLNNGTQISVKNLSLGIPKLICYYSSQSCGACVDFAIKKIEEFFPNSDSDVLFIAANFNDKMKFRNKNTLNIGTEKLGMELDTSMYVCYFVLLNGRVEHLFIPEKNYSGFTDQYLGLVKKKYFSNIQKDE